MMATISMRRPEAPSSLPRDGSTLYGRLLPTRHLPPADRPALCLCHQGRLLELAAPQATGGRAATMPPGGPERGRLLPRPVHLAVAPPAPRDDVSQARRPRKPRSAGKDLRRAQGRVRPRCPPDAALRGQYRGAATQRPRPQPHPELLGLLFPSRSPFPFGRFSDGFGGICRVILGPAGAGADRQRPYSGPVRTEQAVPPIRFGSRESEVQILSPRPPPHFRGARNPLRRVPVQWTRRCVSRVASMRAHPPRRTSCRGH